MDSRVHGNDGWGWSGDDVLSVYVRVALLMFSVSFFVIPNFFLLTSVY
ncbi:hypothetical protein ACSTD9_20020 [Vibrio vulnificus]